MDVRIVQVGQQWSLETGDVQHTVQLRLPGGGLVTALLSQEDSQAIIELGVRGAVPQNVPDGQVYARDDGVTDFDGAEEFGGDFGESQFAAADVQQHMTFAQPQAPSPGVRVASQTVPMDEAGNPILTRPTLPPEPEEEDPGAQQL